MRKRGFRGRRSLGVRILIDILRECSAEDSEDQRVQGQNHNVNFRGEFRGKIIISTVTSAGARLRTSSALDRPLKYLLM
jgi:hypothetical protein